MLQSEISVNCEAGYTSETQSYEINTERSNLMAQTVSVKSVYISKQ